MTNPAQPAQLFCPYMTGIRAVVLPSTVIVVVPEVLVTVTVTVTLAATDEGGSVHETLPVPVASEAVLVFSPPTEEDGETEANEEEEKERN